MGSSCGAPFEYESDALEHLLEAGDFGGQMLAAGGCDLINAHLAIGRRHTPLGPEQFGLEKALQRGVEGSFLYLQLESTDKSPMESGGYKIRLKRHASDPHEYWAFSRDGFFLSLPLGISPSPIG